MSEHDMKEFFPALKIISANWLVVVTLTFHSSKAFGSIFSLKDKPGGSDKFPTCLLAPFGFLIERKPFTLAFSTCPDSKGPV